MILCLETSSPRASLAVIDPTEKEILWSASFETNRAHNAAIFGPVEELLTHHRGSLTGIAVGLGPGSYGGVRVGIAVANGIGMVLGIPAFGVSSLESWEVEADSYAVIGDARRRSFFVAEVRDRRLASGPDLISDEEADERISRLLSAGAVVTADRTVADRWPEVLLSNPSAAKMATLPFIADIAAMESDSLPPLEPIYLRAPYITEPKRKG